MHHHRFLIRLLAALWLGSTGAACLGSAAAPPAPGVAFERGVWRLEPQGARTAELVQALARASGSELHSNADALAALRPLRRPVQAASLAEAWQALLSTSTSHALQCERRRCRVWILSPAPPAKAPPPTATPALHFEPPATYAPGSSVAQEPDPPGLFPDD